MKSISHIAIGVTDMDRSLPFYRDVLGMKVTLDALEGRDPEPGADPPPSGGLNRGPGRQRRAVYLRWEEGPESTFIVLSAPSVADGPVPLRLDQLGHHHFGF